MCPGLGGQGKLYHHIVNGSAQSSKVGPGAIFDKCEHLLLLAATLAARIGGAGDQARLQGAGRSHGGPEGLRYRFLPLYYRVTASLL